jgi:dolichol-phosphate mannosyltransferase
VTTSVVFSALALVLLLLQIPATAILLARLLPGIKRRRPLQQQPSVPEHLGAVTVLVPTLNEAQRLSPCLSGLSHQGYEVREILVIDSNSQDGTPDLVKHAQTHDPRFRLLTDPPLPSGWVGRPWALHTGFLQSADGSTWILGIDADTQPQPGLVASLLAIATDAFDLISLSPQFILQFPGEWWLQPALLMTLLYRFGPGGTAERYPERVLANGQCFLIRRSLLTDLGGYSGVKGSFCDDVALARLATGQGARVAFLDGAQLLKVRMYEGARETWQEWGRSLDLKDATSVEQKWADLGFLLAVQGLPIPLTLLGLWVWLHLGSNSGCPVPILLSLGLNLALLAMRFGMLGAIAPSYQQQRSWASALFWLSPFADPLAVLRIAISSGRIPRQWRGRVYCPE